MINAIDRVNNQIHKGSYYKKAMYNNASSSFNS